MKRQRTQKLDFEDIPLIRGLLAQGMTCKEIAEKFEVSIETISRIKTGKTWAFLTDVAK